VPEGKRLVIEQVSVDIRVKADAAQSAEAAVGTQVGNTVTTYHIPGVSVTPFTAGLTAQRFLASSQMRSYADPGTQACVGAASNVAGEGDTFVVNLSGYLVDVP
jgi:hypothetical protein